MKKRPSAPALEWLCDLSGKTARITTVGREMLLVENHRGVLHYDGQCIHLGSRCGTIEICGDDLQLSQVRSDALIVRGRIHQLKLPWNEEQHHER